MPEINKININGTEYSLPSGGSGGGQLTVNWELSM